MQADGHGYESLVSRSLFESMRLKLSFNERMVIASPERREHESRKRIPCFALLTDARKVQASMALD